jgi:PAS domain S-box-containing protein
MEEARRAVLAAWEPLSSQLARAPLPALVLAPDRRVLLATRPVGGWEPAALQGQPLDDLLAEDPQRLAPAVASALAGGAETVEVGLRAPGAPAGSKPWSFQRLSLSPLGLEAAPVGVLVLAHDVTPAQNEARALRQRDGLFIDAQGVAHLGVWEWDLSQPVAVWSDELFRIYGLDPRTHAPTYEDYLTRVHPDDRQRVMAATERVFYEHIPYSHDERIFRTDGSMRYLHTWAQPILDEHGKLVRLIGVCQDITDRTLAEQTRDRLLEETREALRLREEFIAVASHELRTPLTPLKGYLQSLRKLAANHENEPRLVARVDASLRQLGRLVGLVDLLLDVSRARRGQLDLECAPCELGALIHEVAAGLEPEIRAARSSLRLELPGEVHGSWDRVRLGQMMHNLLSNAVKFGAGRPIDLRVSRPEPARARIEVEDHGPGISPEAAERIFGPFERAAPVQNYPGMGLGLYIVREIAVAHGGEVRLASAIPGAGATFVVELPCEVT